MGRSVASEGFQFSPEGVSRKDSRAGAQHGVWGHYLVGVFRAWEGQRMKNILVEILHVM